MNYQEKLISAVQFIEENIDDPSELVAILELTVEDLVKLLPDILVKNYRKFIVYDNTEEDPFEEDEEDDGVGEDGEEEEEDSY